LSLEQIKPELMSDEEFVSGIVDNIMTNSNLSDIIEQIDAVQNENRELRELLYAQQKTINEMNIMLLKLFSQSMTPPPTPTPIATSTPTPTPITDATIMDADADTDADADQEDEQGDGSNIQLEVSNMQTVD